MAQVIIRNMNDLQKVFENRIKMALKLTQDEMLKVFQEHFKDYYEEPVFKNGTSATPSVYNRTYKMLNSILKTEIVRTNNSFYCTVGVDENYLDYKYVGGISGLDVLLSANEQFHGWTIEGDIRVWDDAMSELGLEYGIVELMKRNLIKCGIPVK